MNAFLRTIFFLQEQYGSRLHFSSPKVRNLQNLALFSLLAPMFFDYHLSRSPSPSWPLLDVKRESEVDLVRHVGE